MDGRAKPPSKPRPKKNARQGHPFSNRRPATALAISTSIFLPAGLTPPLTHSRSAIVWETLPPLILRPALTYDKHRRTTLPALPFLNTEN